MSAVIINQRHQEIDSLSRSVLAIFMDCLDSELASQQSLGGDGVSSDYGGVTLAFGKIVEHARLRQIFISFGFAVLRLDRLSA